MRESGWITGDEINPFRIQWPAWSAAGWLSGVTILQTRVDLSVKGWREVSAATLRAGWVDDGSGWDYSGLPHGWSNPLPVARALWCVPAAGAAVESVPVVSSGLGGWAFDSSAGRLLARVGDDELMRDLEGTTAYWVAPDLYSGEQLSRVGSVMSVEGEVYYMAESWGIGVWDDGAWVTLEEPQWDDWVLVVHRTDPVEDRLTVDLFRQRDGAHLSEWCELSWLSWQDVLTPASDYFLGGYLAVQVVGGSYWWTRYGSARFDRIGFWRRALSDVEVEELFNYGLGWRPD
jgi:hypothetical protein